MVSSKNHNFGEFDILNLLYQPFFVFILFMFMVATACQTQTESPAAAPPQVPLKEEREVIGPNENLPLLPSIQSDNGYGMGEPLTGGVQDPFSQATFALETQLPTGVKTAVVQQHSFGQMDAAKARTIANQFGFTGPLYIQQIAPEFAPPPGEEAPIIYTAFDGHRVLMIGESGVNYENRGLEMDYSHRTVFAEAAPPLEDQLKAWGLLDFPYEFQESFMGDVMIYRLLDDVAAEQNEFNLFANQANAIAYLNYPPGRLVDTWGNYPLQTAESAWQRLQTAAGREGIRYQLYTPPSDDAATGDFVNPRSWSPLAENGQEMHLYITPAVYEATDGSGLHLVFGDYTLAGDKQDLAEIATHLSDVLHVWGTVEIINGVKNLNITDWEKIDMVQYETVEGTLVQEDGQSLVRTADNETFILAAAPELPKGVEVYVSAAARRDIGAAYPVLDWNSITEKIEWPDVPMAVVDEEAAIIKNVNIDSAELVYFVLRQFPADPQMSETLLYLPTWKFSGTTNLDQIATFWLSAVAPEYLQTESQPAANSASINGWVWHDLCATAMDGEPALTSTPNGCIEATSALGNYHANGHLDEMEPLIGDVAVRLGAGACPSTGLAETTTIVTDLSYSFTGLAAGTYCVSINPSEEPNLSLLRPGIWTSPEVSESTIDITVTLAEGENAFDINFGWDHQFLP
jgi:hypothetical protein